MRALDEIKQDLAATRERRDRIKDDIDGIFARANGERLDDGRAERVGNLSEGLSSVNAEVESLEDEWRSAMEEVSAPASSRPTAQSSQLVGRVNHASMATLVFGA
jgi:hypothetical protein